MILLLIVKFNTHENRSPWIRLQLVHKASDLLGTIIMTARIKMSVSVCVPVIWKEICSV